MSKSKDFYFDKIDNIIKQNSYFPLCHIEFDSPAHRWLVSIGHLLHFLLLVFVFTFLFMLLITSPALVGYFAGYLYDIINGTAHCEKYWTKVYLFQDPFKDGRDSICFQNAGIVLTYFIIFYVICFIGSFCYLYVYYGAKMDPSLQKND